MHSMTTTQTQRLSALYSHTGLAFDRLPYTPQFENLFIAFTVENYLAVTRNDVWHALTYLRMRSRLPRKGRVQ